MEKTKEYSEPGTMAHAIDVDSISGPELMDVACFADTFVNMKLLALDKARRFYGQGAELRIVNMSNVVDAEREDGTEGCFAHVWVLCLNLAEEDRYPASLDELFS